MAKTLVVDCDKCTLCGLCVMVCSVKHEGEFNPLKARITLDRVMPEGMMVPKVCWQCDSPAPCEESCPVEAISRSRANGAVVIDHEICTLCETCVEACPYDNVKLSPDCDKMLKCDLCGGDPECVKYCAYGTLSFVDADPETLESKNRVKEEIAALLKL
ncbi:MAG: 4Fe-4S dicluster domain-containing protein [Desulfobacterales bacterium]|nr:4Fe-4S dicluster domain-containing protein [Desulfobacterales bacterium]